MAKVFSELDLRQDLPWVKDLYFTARIKVDMQTEPASGHSSWTAAILVEGRESDYGWECKWDLTTNKWEGSFYSRDGTERQFEGLESCEIPEPVMRAAHEVLLRLDTRLVEWTNLATFQLTKPK